MEKAMVNQELVSIIVPVYNSEKYLEACLQSVLVQTYRNIEILLIDDGSTDQSGAICDAYAKKDARIHVFHNQNHGVSYSRNCGIKIAGGKYLTFVDCDDTVSVGYIESLMKYVGRYDLVLSVINDVYPDQNKEFTRSLNWKELSHNFANDYWKLAGAGFASVSWGKIYKKEIILQNRIFFPEKADWGEDRYFNFNYYRFISSYIFSTNSYYNYYHRNTDSLSKRDNRADDTKLMIMIIENYKRFLWEKKVNKREQLLFDQCAQFWLYAGSGYIPFYMRCKIIKQYVKEIHSASTWKRGLILKCIKHGWNKIIYIYYRIKWMRQQWRSQ